MTDILPKLDRLDAFDPALADLLRPTVERLGYLGEFFQQVGILPQAMQRFMDYTKAVKEPLPDSLNELLALTVCGRMGAEYERIQHERLSLKLGFTPDWIAAAAGRPEAPESALSAQEIRVRALALAMLEDQGRGVDDELAAVARDIGPERTVAVLLQTTRFMTIATLCNSLKLRLPVPSIFDPAAA